MQLRAEEDGMELCQPLRKGAGRECECGCECECECECVSVSVCERVLLSLAFLH